VPVTALLLDTTRLGKTKQALAIAGVTAKAMVPVNPFCGVTVIVEVMELPSVTVAAVADMRKVFWAALATVKVTEPLEDA